MRLHGGIRYNFNFKRFNSTALKWPFGENDRFSTRLLQVESHWKEICGSKKSPPVRPGSKTRYVLSMFPYPSGNLHMGHMRVYTISDTLARYYRLAGHQVIHPIGWDAFGLPAENAARERGVDSKEWTYSNIDTMREQLRQTGVNFDWDRELFTCDPSYYKWTQWIFMKMYEKGLVKRTLAEVNWDPIDNTVLAAEQIDADGKSWRSGAIAEKRKLRQWMIETPKYAKVLSDGLHDLAPQWEEVASIQSHWIGPCDVHRFIFPIKDVNSGTIMEETLDLRLFDPLHLSQSAFVVINRDHPLAEEQKKNGTEPYILDRMVLNGVTGAWLPIAVAPSSLLDSLQPSLLGARLSHVSDETWAKSIGLPTTPPRNTMSMNLNDVVEIAQFGGFGGYVTSRSLTDWVVSRQRAWGTPIPMVLSEDKLLAMPLRDNQLPLIQGKDVGQKVECDQLPGGFGFTETDTLDTFFDSAWYYLRYLDPHNPDKLVNFEKAKQSMPVSVYVGGIEHAAVHMFFARFMCHFLYDIGVSPVKEPFRDLVPQGIVKGRTFVLKNGKYVKNEEVNEEGPFPVLKKSGESVQMIYEKMSKSKHNGVDPLQVLVRDGVDLSRLQLLSTVAPKAPINWGDADLRGLSKWLDRMAAVVNRYIEARKGATNDGQLLSKSNEEEKIRENYNFFVRTISTLLDVLQIHNTAIARLIGLTNSLRKLDPSVFAHSEQAERTLRSLIIMLQVFAPHSAAELWAAMKTVRPIKELSTPVLEEQRWPEVDDDAEIDFVLKINGKSCGRVSVPRREVEDLTAMEAVEKSRNKEHNVFIRLLEKRGYKIIDAEVDERRGMFYYLNAKVEPSIEDDKVGKILDAVVAEKLAEKRMKKQKEGGSKHNKESNRMSKLKENR